MIHNLMITAMNGVPDLPRSGVTIFAVPKCFGGHFGTIQRNAIRSWARLQPRVQILLFGQEDAALQDLAAEAGAVVLPVKTNRNGTPVLQDVFEQAHACARYETLCYINSDIILGPELLHVAEQLQQSSLGSFVAIGQRTELVVTEELAWDDGHDFAEWQKRAVRSGKLDSVVCKDYFLFSTDLYRQVPEFLVGRGTWDNWMVAIAKSGGTAVVDITSRVVAIHQDHDYRHVAGGRKCAYVFGWEARHNQRLAGGRYLVRGSTATWELGPNGPKRRRFPVLTMIRDLPRFISLVRNLMILGYLLARTTLWI
jgi:hypothetical protein